VLIDNGADGAPDTVHVLASGQRGFALPIALGSNHASTDSVFTLKAGGTGSTLGVNVGNAQGDLMLVISADTTPANCTLFGLNVDGMTPLLLGPGGTWADGTPLATVAAGTPLSEASPAPAGSVAVGRRLGHAGADSGAGIWNKSTPLIATTLTADRSYLVNLGQPGDMIYRSYAVDSKGLALTEFDFATATQQATADSYAGIVSLQAVYGKALGNTNQQADTWNADNPAADAVTGTGNGWSRVVAIRIAVVARSAQYEKTEVTTALPQWRPDPAAAPVSIKVDGNPDWQHYRYKVYETTVPLRNVIWQS
jgi:type IV pilus assembly protein PilW